MSQKKEMRRVLSNLSNLVCKPVQCAIAKCSAQIATCTLFFQAEHIKSNIPGCEMMFTVVKKNTHYCGGTDKGCQYLEQEAPWIHTPSQDPWLPNQVRTRFSVASWRQIARSGSYFNENHNQYCILIGDSNLSGSFTSQTNAVMSLTFTDVGYIPSWLNTIMSLDSMCSVIPRHPFPTTPQGPS